MFILGFHMKGLCIIYVSLGFFNPVWDGKEFKGSTGSIMSESRHEYTATQVFCYV